MHNANRLHVLDVAVQLAVSTYDFTALFPVSERFGLTDQMNRACISVGSNIAEGAGRFTDPQFVQFLGNANGSASELDFQTRVACELKFAPWDAGRALRDQISQTQRMIGSLRRSLLR